jgi:dynein heavy chain
VETAVYDLVKQLQSGLPEEDKKNLTAEEGYQCYTPDTKNKKSRCQECIACSFYSLLNYFTQRNTEALVKG